MRRRRDDEVVQALVREYVLRFPGSTVTMIARGVGVRDQTVRRILATGPFSSSTRTGKGGTAIIYSVALGAAGSPSHRVVEGRGGRERSVRDVGRWTWARVPRTMSYENTYMPRRAHRRANASAPPRPDTEG